MNINTEDYKKEGLYLHFSDGGFLDISRERIEKLGEEYWHDPRRLPESIRDHHDFKTCTVCPF